MAVNVDRGWPLEQSSIQDNFPPKAGENIIEGMLVKIDANGEVIKANGAQKEVTWLSIDSQSAADVRGSNKIPLLAGPIIYSTDQFITATYTFGMELQVSTTAGQEGLLMPHTGGTSPTVGWVNRVSIEHDGASMLQVLKPMAFGTAQ